MANNPMRNGRYNPCYGCPDHQQPCSAHCTKPEYLAWKAEQETIRRNRGAYNDLNDYVHRQSEKNRRARK